MFTVLKGFKTATQVLSPGDAVEESQVPDFADKQKLGFISGGEPDVEAAPAAEPVVEEAPADPVPERKKR